MTSHANLCRMSKDKSSIFTCNDCGATCTKWVGQCQGCKAWNTIEEQRSTSTAASKHRYAPLAASAPVVMLNAVQGGDVERTPTGISELDRVLGGGVVLGSVVLLGGEPGVGKSTCLLQAMDALNRQGVKTLYISGEESAQQIAGRAKRLGMGNAALPFQAEIQLQKILETIENQKPQVVVIDSIQTLWSDELTAAPGSVSQVKECAAQLTRLAKSTGTAIFLVGHLTKDNQLAGPRVLEHIVDTCAIFEGEANSNYRIIRAIKNRFGPVNEVGVFAMTETGLKSVTNPSAIFMSSHSTPVPGSCIMATIDGTRPILVEIQSLVDGGGPSPRRLSIGLERDRLSMLLAILNKHGAVQTSSDDVYVNAVGGLKVSEPASDLAVILAIHSSIRSKAIPQGVIVFGEVGLAGEVRPAPKGELRLREAAKLGFSSAIIPRANAPKKQIPGMTIYPVERIDEALQAVRNLP